MIRFSGAGIVRVELYIDTYSFCGLQRSRVNGLERGVGAFLNSWLERAGLARGIWPGAWRDRLGDAL